MTIKQERERQKRRWEKRQVAASRQAEQEARFKRLAAVVGTVVVVLGLVAAAGLAFGSSSDTPSASEGTSTAAASGLTAAGCPQPPKPVGTTTAKLDLPDKATAAGRMWTATVTTNCGDIVLTLDGTKAPQAVASFLQLAKVGYWLNSPCHRLTQYDELRVLQCGDPTGTGSGTPGYGFAVENTPADAKYPRGTLAMARTQDAQKGNGGQFFIVYDNSTIGTPKEPGYTIFGQVTSGLDIVDKVARAGIAGSSQQDGAPAAPISILRVAVTEKKA